MPFMRVKKHPKLLWSADHGVGSTDHFSALKIWMFENKFVSLPSHLKTIEPMARPIREKSGTGVYHVMLRGINRQDIFEDEEDYLQMTSILRRTDGQV